MASARSNAQMFALVTGAVYLLIGIAGFFVTGFGDFASETGEKLILFPVNPLHNVVHVILGAGWLWASTSHATARSINMLYGIVLLLVTVLGMLGVLKFLAIADASSADNYLHLVTGAASLYFGTAGARDAAAAT